MKFDIKSCSVEVLNGNMVDFKNHLNKIGYVNSEIDTQIVEFCTSFFKKISQTN